MVFLWIALFVLVLLSIVFSYFFFIPFFFGAPYEPSRGKALKNIIGFTNPKKGDRIVELGSGDGRVCIALARQCVEIDGYEINPFLVWISRRKIKKANLKNIHIYWKSFWKVDLSKYNKVVLFQFKTIANKLSKKFKKELSRGSLIISHWWRIPKLKVQKKIGRVYLYKIH